jgi:LmbE family N-acetylglucosaminyl deacetylase
MLASLLAAFVIAAMAGCAPRAPSTAVTTPPGSQVETGTTVPPIRPAAPGTQTIEQSAEETPGSKTAVIFYSPHPDDESLAAAQAIRRWVRAKRPVYVVLLTDGEASRAFAGYYRRHPELWRDYDRDGDSGDHADFGLARRAEFTRAVTSLGVPRDHITYYGAAGRSTRDALRRDFFPRAQIMQIMRGFEKRFPHALHVTVMKYTDGDPRGAGDAFPQQEHRAACEALRRLVDTDHVDGEFYKVYVYDLPPAKRWAPHIEGDTTDHRAKVAALEDGYDRAGSTRDHLGIGWASVPETFRACVTDTREYRTEPEDFK